MVSGAVPERQPAWTFPAGPLARVIVRQTSGSYFGRLSGDRFVLASPTVEMEGAHTSIALISGSVSVNPLSDVDSQTMLPTHEKKRRSSTTS